MMRNSPRAVLLVVIFILVALIGGAVLFSGDDEPETVTKDGEELTNVTLFLTFIPNVQFAPIYVAIENGYFADEGLNVVIEHGDEPVGIDRIATNDLQFGIISGEQVIVGRNAEKPLVYVMEWYHRFPVGVVVPADSEITTAADLDGKTIGISFLNGASYMGARALFAAVGLTEDDVQLEPIGFTAPAVMCERQLDGAIVYIANEPLQIEECYAVRVIEITDYVSLISNGLITNEATIADNPEMVEGMVRAILRGVEFTIASPDEAFDISLAYVPDLSEEQYDVQREVLRRSTVLWQSDTPGATTLDAWENTQQVMIEADFIDAPLADLAAAFTNDFLPTASD